jgi:hypothetical protein
MSHSKKIVYFISKILIPQNEKKQTGPKSSLTVAMLMIVMSLPLRAPQPPFIVEEVSWLQGKELVRNKLGLLYVLQYHPIHISIC